MDDVFSNDSVDIVWLDKATQASRMMIDEEGCKAASLTTMLNESFAMSTGEVTFVLDSPFIFEIMSETGLPLFVGIIKIILFSNTSHINTLEIYSEQKTYKSEF